MCTYLVQIHTRHDLSICNRQPSKSSYMTKMIVVPGGGVVPDTCVLLSWWYQCCLVSGAHPGTGHPTQCKLPVWPGQCCCWGMCKSSHITIIPPNMDGLYSNGMDAIGLAQNHSLLNLLSLSNKSIFNMMQFYRWYDAIFCNWHNNALN